MTHIAVVPARQGSVGFPGKNRIFFNRTADFLPRLPWLSRVVVSSNDPVIVKMAAARGFEVHRRPEQLAGPAVSIKAVFESVVADMGIAADDVVWLFYLPVLYKNVADFTAALSIIERLGVESLCTFVPAKTHPFNCWRIDEATGRLSQYVPNDVFRRQDMPPAWMHYHYVCCFKVRELPNLNSELLNTGTYPLLLDRETAANLIEVDTPEDYERWKKRCAESKSHDAA